MENILKKEVIKLINILEKDLIYIQEMLTQKTIGGEEHLIRDMIIHKLKELGFNYTIDGLGNIAATRGISKAMVLLNAHQDIVDCSFSYNYSYDSYYSDYSMGYDYDKSLEKNAADYFINDGLFECEYDFYDELNLELAILKDGYNCGDISTEEVIEAIDKHTRIVSHYELEEVGYNCSMCKHKCIEGSMCKSFELNPKYTDSADKILNFWEERCAYAYDVYQEFIYTLEEASFKDEPEKEELEEKKKPSYEVIVDKSKNKIYGKGETRVLGGDDKAGIFIALKVAEILRDMPMKLLFTVQEESGCIGIKHFIKENKEFFEDVKYSLTIDRKGGDNLLWSQLGTRSCDNEFAAKLSREGVKAGIPVKLMDGNVADVIYIRDLVPNSVNMSAGYYSAHTSDEYIVISELDSIIEWVKNILTNV